MGLAQRRIQIAIRARSSASSGSPITPTMLLNDQLPAKATENHCNEFVKKTSTTSVTSFLQKT